MNKARFEVSVASPKFAAAQRQSTVDPQLSIAAPGQQQSALTACDTKPTLGQNLHATLYCKSTEALITVLILWSFNVLLTCQSLHSVCELRARTLSIFVSLMPRIVSDTSGDLIDVCQETNKQTNSPH